MNMFSFLPRVVSAVLLSLSLWTVTSADVSAAPVPQAESTGAADEQLRDYLPSGYVLQVTGKGGVPADGVTAVALNVTVSETEIGAHNGFVTVFPCGDRPDASNLNFVANQTVPNLVIAPVNEAGEVCLYVYGRAGLIVDVSGYFTTGIETLTPTRLLDTRGGEKVGALDGNGDVYRLQVTGAKGIPADGVTAVAMNVTATESETGEHNGFVTVFPCGERPDASNLNFVAGQTVPNLVIAPVSADGEVCFYVYGKTHLLADVSGYFTTGIETLTPTRLLDTRRGGDKIGAFDGNGSIHRLQVTGSNGVPAEGVTAVAMNVTATESEIGAHNGFVTVFPCGGRPDASNLNFAANQTVPNLVIAPVSADGEVCFYVYGKTHLLADVSGYFTTGIETLTPTRILDTRPLASLISPRKVGDLEGTSPTNRTEACIQDYFGCLTQEVHSYIDTAWTIADHNPPFPVNFFAGDTGWIGPCMGSECGYFSTRRSKAWSVSDLSFADFEPFADNYCPGQVSPGQENDDYYKAACGSGHPAGGSFEVKWSAGALYVSWDIGVATAPGFDSWSDWYRETQGDLVESCAWDVGHCLPEAVGAYTDTVLGFDDHQPQFDVEPTTTGWSGECNQETCESVSLQRERRWVGYLQWDDFVDFAGKWCPGTAVDYESRATVKCAVGHAGGGEYEVVRWSQYWVNVKWTIPAQEAPGFDNWGDWYRNEGKDL